MCLGNWSRVNREVQARFLERVRGQFPRPTHHNDGLAIWYKRLERGTFKFPISPKDNSFAIDIATLTLILSGFEPNSVKRLRRFKIKENQRKTA